MDPKFMQMIGNLMMGMAQTPISATDWSRLFQSPSQAPFDPAAVWEGYKTWLNMLGGVPLAEYRGLQAKYDRLKTQCDQQQATIQALQAMLLAKDGLQNSFVENLNHYAEEQGRLVKGIFENLLQDDNPPEPPAK